MSAAPHAGPLPPRWRDGARPLRGHASQTPKDDRGAAVTFPQGPLHHARLCRVCHWVGRTGQFPGGGSLTTWPRPHPVRGGLTPPRSLSGLLLSPLLSAPRSTCPSPAAVVFLRGGCCHLARGGAVPLLAGLRRCPL